MGLLDTLRLAVRIADSVTKSVQAEVSYERCLSKDGSGTKTYGAPVKMKAITELTQRQVRTTTGVLSVCSATVMFLDIVDLKLRTSNLGISDDDRITLPDGKTGPILNFSGFVDAGTKLPLATQVYLG